MEGGVLYCFLKKQPQSPTKTGLLKVKNNSGERAREASAVTPSGAANLDCCDGTPEGWKARFFSSASKLFTPRRVSQKSRYL